MPIDLSSWFDCTKKIRREDIEIAEAQMALYAWKDGIDPDGQETRSACAELRRAVKEHNQWLLQQDHPKAIVEQK